MKCEFCDDYKYFKEYFSKSDEECNFKVALKVNCKNSKSAITMGEHKLVYCPMCGKKVKEDEI